MKPLLYSIPVFGLQLNAVASDDDIIPGKRRVVDGLHSLRKNKKRSLVNIDSICGYTA